MAVDLRTRRVAITLIGVIGLALIAWSLAGLYSVRDPYAPALEPIREFLEAGLAGDTTRLRSLGAGTSAREWALETGRQNPALLEALREDLSVGGGMTRGDTAVVFLRGSRFRGCSSWPLTILFTGTADAPRIHEVRANCAPKPATRSRN